VTGWRVAVDRGGTFADVVALDPEGRVHVRKLLARGAPEADALAAVLPPGAVLDELRVGTTVATNALLTGEGAPAAILLNRGFGDLLRIGHQARPELFALHPRRQPPLVPRAVEVDGRIRADGSVEEELDEEGLARAFAELRSDGIESLAVALLHAWINPAHERRIGALAGAAGFAHVALSSDLAPQPGLLERAWTAEVDASLTPILRAWLRTVDAACPPGARLLAMQSSGGLCAAGDLRGAQAPSPTRRRSSASARSSGSTWAARRPTSAGGTATSSGSIGSRSTAAACAPRRSTSSPSPRVEGPCSPASTGASASVPAPRVPIPAPPATGAGGRRR
jgi:5-oxoprolinase (ATP-hydrolysing)